ncbi:MAG: MFS transporter [Chloroflexota bacterium]
MRSRLTGLWRHPDFMKLWVAETVSLFGSQITVLALPLTAAFILNANPVQMGFLEAAQFAPFLLIGLFAGVWVDRRRRRPILIMGDIGRGLLLASIPLAALFHMLGLGQLYIVAFLVGILTLFFDVAYQAYLPSLVSREHLVEGNSKLEISRAIAQIGGPGLAGILIKLLTAPLTIVLDALSFFISALFLWRVKTQEAVPVPRAEGRHMLHEIREGLGVVFGSPILRSIAGCTSMANLFGSMQLAVYILFVTRELKLDPAALGLVFSVGSIGGLLGAFLTQRIATRLGVGPAIIVSASMFGITAILVPLAVGTDLVSIGLLIASQFIMGVSGVIYNVNQVSLRQSITPDRLQGRMNASMRFLVWGVMPIGSLIGGFLGEQIGLRGTLWVAAAGSLLAFLWVLFSPLRSLHEQPAPVDEVPAVIVA